MIVRIVLKEGLVTPDDLSIFFEPLPDSVAKVDDPFDAIGRHERVAVDFAGLLSNSIHASGALDQPDDGPWQIVVHDHVTILEVLTFAKHIGRDQHPQLMLRLYHIAFLVALGAE